MRVLVAYASGFGTTAEVAREIADRLAHQHLVDLRTMATVRSLEPYDAVVIGSSLRAGRWLGAMNRFLSRFAKDLATKPVFIFTVALTARTREGSRRVLSENLPRLLARYPMIKPLSTEAFGGVVDYERYNLLVRGIVRKVAAEEGLPTSGIQDFRDWEAIRQWAEEIGERLAQSSPASAP